MLRQVLLLVAYVSPIACDQLDPLIADSQPNTPPGHCAPPPEWATGICADAPSVANLSFYHYTPCRDTGAGFLPSKYSMVKLEDLDALVLAKGTDTPHAACYSQRGSCLAVGHHPQGRWGSEPQRSFLVSADGQSITDVYTGEVYTQKGRDMVYPTVCVNN